MKPLKTILVGFAAIFMFVACSHKYVMSKNRDCDKQNTGDFCFKNKTKYVLQVFLNKGNRDQHVLTVKPGQKQYFYDLKAGSTSYNITSNERSISANYSTSGNIFVQSCKNKIFVIK